LEEVLLRLSEQLLGNGCLFSNVATITVCSIQDVV